MGTLKTTKKLQGDYGELIFEHFCHWNNYAYISLEEIYKTLRPNNKLVFRHGYHRIIVDLPEDIVSEVTRVCKPSNKRDNEPSFVFDYLTVSLRMSFGKTKEDENGNFEYIQIRPPTRKAFNWVEIKTGKSELSRNQKATMEVCTLPVCVFRIPIEVPEEIEVNWDKEYHPDRYKKEGEKEEDYTPQELAAAGFSAEEVYAMTGIYLEF